MSIQTIIDNATFITIEYNKIAAQSISRSGRLLTAELASAVPFKITVGMHEGLTYSDNRDLLAELGKLDVTEEETVDIGGTNSGLSYVTAYQGDLSQAQLNTIQTATTNAFSGANINLNTTFVVGGSGWLFRKGDYIQIGPTNGRYPYIVVEDVAFSSSSSLAIPVHRTVIDQNGFSQTSRSIAVGKDVDFRVKMIRKPSYTVVPYDRIQFTSDFELVEVIRKEDA
jgi:hypothetical protein